MRKRSCAVRSVVAQALVAWTVAAGDVNDLPALSEWTSFEGRAQAKTVVKYDRPDRRPIWFGARSRCEGVAPGGDYCLFLDLIEEGGNEWAIKTFFPEWDTTSSHRMPGDGVYLYPGREHVLPGIRLANLRDGVEDYEWLQLAESLAGRDAVEALIGRVVRSKTDFTRDPASLRAVRRQLGDLIEGFAASGIQKEEVQRVRQD